MEQESTPRMSDYWAILKRRGTVAAAVGLPVLVIALVLAVALPDVYRSTATFQLRSGTDPQAVRQDEDYADRYVSSLSRDVLQSRSRNEFLAEVKPYPDLERADASMKVMGSSSVGMITEKILDPASGRERDINTGFNVSYNHRDPQIAQRGADWLAQRFLEISRQDAAVKMADQAKFYAAEAERTRVRIDELERKLAAFKSENFDKLPTTAQSNMAVRSQSEQELAGIQREMNTLQQTRGFLMTQLQQARSTNIGGQTLYQLEDEYRRKRASYDENHPDMVALRRQIEGLKQGATTSAGMTLQQQLRMKRGMLTEIRQRYSENHPDVRRMTRDIEELEGRIARGERAPVEQIDEPPAVMQIRTQLNATDAQLASLQLRSTELRERIKDIEVRLASTPEVERDFEVLTRDVGAARQQYDQLLSRRMDADLQAAGIAAGNADKFRLIERPRVPEKAASPKRVAIGLFGVIGSLALAFLAVLVAEMLDSTVRSTRDVEELLQTAPLAVIPEIRSPDYRPWRTREAKVFATSLLAGIPIVYLVARLLTQ